MKLTKTFLPVSSVFALAFVFSACSASPGGNSITNNANQSNAATVVNASPKAENKTTPAANAVNSSNSPANKASTKPDPASGSGEETTVSGKFQTGKTESLILYVGMETGDYAAYCFANDSEAGRAIAAACKNGDECEVTGETADGKCAVPGLEADLSASARIVKVKSVKSLGPQKRSN
jgi:hypothetical protein